MVCVEHEADRSRDPRGHNETRSTLTENGTELTMSTNLQLSLRQLAPIECRRRPFRPPRGGGGEGAEPHLSFSTSSPFYFLVLMGLDPLAAPVETFTPRARDCRK